jgi:large-conductance mechanosensitive channel
MTMRQAEKIVLEQGSCIANVFRFVIIAYIALTYIILAGE